MDRRRLLTVVGGSVVTLSIAGCLGSDDEGSNGDGDSDDGSNGSDDGSSNGDGDTAALIESADRTLAEAADEF